MYLVLSLQEALSIVHCPNWYRLIAMARGHREAGPTRDVRGKSRRNVTRASNKLRVVSVCA